MEDRNDEGTDNLKDGLLYGTIDRIKDSLKDRLLDSIIDRISDGFKRWEFS